MRVQNGLFEYAATDISNYLGCPHLTLLKRLTALGGPKPPAFDDPSIDVLQQRGLQHEHRFLEGLGENVVEIEGPDVAGTLDAMRAGAAVIYQGALRNGAWFGLPDFLKRVDRPSALGDWSYEVVDAKLAREAKGGALLQLLVYADLLEHAQGSPPEFVHLALGGPEPRTVSFRVKDYQAYFTSLQKRFVDHVENAPESTPHAPDPVAHCAICDWKMRCDKERRDVDHLSLVADIRTSQRRVLEEIGIATVEALAEADVAKLEALDGTSRRSLEKIRDQARIQVRGRRLGRPTYELLTPVREGEGLAALPPPSAGDLFFDLEGDPYALTDGIEYLFGYVDVDGEYTALWALDRDAEKRAFEAFIDLVMERLARHPDLHIYHFAPYETTAMKKLMGRYATREEEMDRLLRGEVFVDLHRVVRQSLRASVESYSIKKLEPFYEFARSVELRQASSALTHFEAWLELHGSERRDDRGEPLEPRAGSPDEEGEPRGSAGSGEFVEERRSSGDDPLEPFETPDRDNELLDQIEGYNRDDCLSTLRLREWLESRREELADTIGADVPRPEAADPTPAESVAEEDEAVARLSAALTDAVPSDPDARAPEQQARWILAQLLGFHRREQKSGWWEYFRCRELTDEELIDDRSTLGGLEYVDVVGAVDRSYLHEYRFPHQEHPFSEGDEPHDPETGSGAGAIWMIDESRGTIRLKRGKRSKAPHPRGLISSGPLDDKVHRASVRRVAQAVVERGLGDEATYRSAADLLMRRAPRVGQIADAMLLDDGEENLDAAKRLVARLDRSILPIQGPPGSGKSYTGARMIVEALRSGKRVGITAMSHKVISNLLEKVCEAAKKVNFEVRGIQNATKAQWCGAKSIEATKKAGEIVDALASGDRHLAAGTSWFWSREDMVGAVDLLFIDEAGQYSLADAIAVAPAADSLVLLGDPKQLDKPQQGVHPPGSDASALGHILGDAPTMPPDRGLFLEHTWRLHPSICAFTSEIFYDDRLGSREDLEIQRIKGVSPLDGFGLRFVPVDHSGNRNESPEEVDVVASIVSAVLDARATWVDRLGVEHALLLPHILIVAPYNAQVSALAERLPGARVGTVDKFQGQQAPIVIYSMATSTADEAPRGMGFLFSPNRLNVATSRAQALAVVVANPALFEPECRTPEQMRLANAFCRFRELADL